ncbi:MAG: hypothetical protein ACRDIU_03235 [Actinomycetota bacterium]
MKSKRKLGFLGLVALGCMVVAGVAWACTPVAQIVALSPVGGPAGTHLIVTGANFNPGPVEIRWDTLEGPLMGHADNFAVGMSMPDDAAALRADHASAVSGGPSSYSASVPVPEGATPGVYYVSAIQKDSAGQIVGKATASVELTDKSTRSAKTQASTDLWQGFSSNDSRFEVGAPAAAGNGLSTPGAFAGLALLSVGMLGLGAAVATTVRRRRSRAMR